MPIVGFYEFWATFIGFNINDCYLFFRPTHGKWAIHSIVAIICEMLY